MRHIKEMHALPRNRTLRMVQEGGFRLTLSFQADVRFARAKPTRAEIAEITLQPGANPQG
jgi:hypothetical protein